ncbi:MAG: 3-oxoacyl-ACP synthase [Deltaproteobacteria bacterium]|nr:3-oxoacyl-ACP synthase [Deltaproteobacteria bacterium]
MIDVLAISAKSPLGDGEAAWSLGPVGATAATCVRDDEIFRAAGMRKPWSARASVSRRDDPAVTLLLAAWQGLVRFVPRRARVGLAVGTSSGGMAMSEQFFAARREGTVSKALADAATYHAPFRALVDRVSEHADLVRSTHPVTACSASTIAIGLAMGWLERDEVDYAIAGGYDALTVFVAAGFEALGATTNHPPPRPFRKERDGMSLGEGAGLFLLARRDPSRPSREVLARLLGFGARGDAVHLTAPDRAGGGLSRSAIAAMEGVDPSTIDLVSVHGTSTPFNDPMEAKAIAAALGRSIGEVDVHAGKASIGHTLGAAGVLETALAIDAVRRGVLPATAGEGELDDEVGGRPRTVNAEGRVRNVLKFSAAFGGANAALVIGMDREARPVAKHAVREVARVEVNETDDLDRISAAAGVPRDRLARMDGVCRLALHAVAALAAEVGREKLAGAGIVLGTVLATIDVNAVYDDNLRKKGAAFAEGRRFAYTTPNAAAGECAIAFGLTGPNVAVSRGVDAKIEAREIGRDLVTSGQAERVIVVEADAGGPAAREIAQKTGWPVKFGGVARLIERAMPST